MKSKNLVWFGGISVTVIAAAGAWWYINAMNEKKEEQSILNPIFISEANQQSAPDFTLTDQRGQRIRLSSLKGKVVVLQPMDPECTDVCPIVSQELIQANRLLGDQSKDVVYLGLNVNEYHESQGDVMDFSQQHGLNQLPNWHFLTGSTEELKAVWKAYGLDVIPNKDGDVEHSTDLYIIDTSGKERYVGFPDNEETDIGAWSRGIAFFTKKLL